MSPLAAKVTLVTDASKGTGAAIAKALGTAGAAVVVNYAASKQAADAVVAAIKAAGGSAIAIRADVRDAHQVARMFEAAQRVFGALEVVINNASLPPSKPHPGHRPNTSRMVSKVSDADFVTEEAIRRFGPAGGSIVNIASYAGLSTATAMLIVSATTVAMSPSAHAARPNAVTKSAIQLVYRAASRQVQDSAGY